MIQCTDFWRMMGWDQNLIKTSKMALGIFLYSSASRRCVFISFVISVWFLTALQFAFSLCSSSTHMNKGIKSNQYILDRRSIPNPKKFTESDSSMLMISTADVILSSILPRTHKPETFQRTDLTSPARPAQHQKRCDIKSQSAASESSNGERCLDQLPFLLTPTIFSVYEILPWHAKGVPYGMTRSEQNDFYLMKLMQSVVMNAGSWMNPLFAHRVEDFDKNKKSTRHVANRVWQFSLARPDRFMPRWQQIARAVHRQQSRGGVGLSLTLMTDLCLAIICLGSVARSSSAKNSTPKRQYLDAPMYVLCGLPVLFDAWC